jgi:hypothetical protein
MQGSVTIHVRIIRTAALVLGVSCALPLAAQASTLLSGYGGPGQGNQAILGSALLNGPRSGGGGGGSAGTASGSPTAVTANGVAETTSGSGTPSGRAPSGRASKRAQGHARGSATTHAVPRGTRPALTGPAAIASSYPASERGAGPTSVALGLSGEELLYTILALGALLLIGVAGSRVARTIAARSGNG